MIESLEHFFLQSGNRISHDDIADSELLTEDTTHVFDVADDFILGEATEAVTENVCLLAIALSVEGRLPTFHVSRKDFFAFLDGLERFASSTEGTDGLSTSSFPAIFQMVRIIPDRWNHTYLKRWFEWK